MVMVAHGATSMAKTTEYLSNPRHVPRQLAIKLKKNEFHSRCHEARPNDNFCSSEASCDLSRHVPTNKQERGTGTEISRCHFITQEYKFSNQRRGCYRNKERGHDPHFWVLRSPQVTQPSKHQNVHHMSRAESDSRNQSLRHSL